MGVVPNIDLEKLLYSCVTRGLLGDSKTQKTGIYSYTTQLLFLLNPGEHCWSRINRLSVILVPVSKKKLSWHCVRIRVHCVTPGPIRRVIREGI